MPRGVALVVLLAVTGLLSGCTGEDEDKLPVVVVEMMPGERYDPPEVTVPVGTTVHWVNRDVWRHGARGDDGSWRAGGEMVIRGQPLPYTFSTPGVYPYHCPAFGVEEADGTWGGMVGRVIVVDPSLP